MMVNHGIDYTLGRQMKRNFGIAIPTGTRGTSHTGKERRGAAFLLLSASNYIFQVHHETRQPGDPCHHGASMGSPAAILSGMSREETPL